MLFTSWEFLLFIGVLFILYYLIPKKGQWILLLCASLLFYFIAGWTGLIFMGIAVFSTYIIGLVVSDVREKRTQNFKMNYPAASVTEKKLFKNSLKKTCHGWLALAIILNVALLFSVKYLNFTVSGINSLILGTSDVLTFWDIAVPMGIAFYELSAMGYVIDVSRGKYKAERNLAKFALYISFFPVVVQGPILRFDETSKTLYAPHDFDRQRVMHGLLRIAWGYFKKVVIADRILPAVMTLAGDPAQYQGAWSLLLIIFYTVQMYADFTGGIDITLGIAEVFGVKLPENFIRPFFSKTIAEYWRRWHISMGAWFRDYVFYPLSASKGIIKLAKSSRKKLGDGFGRRVPVYVSTLAVWAITGIWHGVTPNFLWWGILNGVIIIISQELTPMYDRFHARFPGALTNSRWRTVQAMRTVAITASLRILDLNPNAGVTFQRFFSIFYTPNYNILVDGSMSVLGLSVADYIIVGAGVAAMLIVSVISRDGSIRLKMENKGYGLIYVGLAAVIVITLLFGAYGIGYDSSQFIYNQF